MNRSRLTALALAGLVLSGTTGLAGAALADGSGSAPAGTTQPDATSSPSASPSTDPSPTASSSPSTPPDQAPVAVDDTAAVQAGQSVTVPVLANDTDPDGGPQPLSVKGTSSDPRLTTSGQDLVFHAGTGDSGTVTLTYTVTDGELTDEGTVTITISPAPTRSVGITVPDRLVALRHYTITGLTRPTGLGRPTVTLQRKSGDSWVALGKDQVDSTGRYRIGYSTNLPRTFVFRAKAVWPDGRTKVSGTSKRTIRVAADAAVSGPLTRSQVPWSYRSGCPVGPSSLRKVTINRIDYRGHVARGTLVVRSTAAKSLVAVFTAAIDQRFPVKSMHPTDYYYDQGRRTPTESDEAAMRAGNTAAFNCRPVTGNPYRISQHSYGNAIDINTVENPYVTGSRVYPSFAREYLDRSPYRKGMILRGGVIASKMAALGWPWGARWSHPDYQHFSSNGG